MWDSQVHSKVPSGPWPEPLGMTARSHRGGPPVGAADPPVIYSRGRPQLGRLVIVVSAANRLGLSLTPSDGRTRSVARPCCPLGPGLWVHQPDPACSARPCCPLGLGLWVHHPTSL